jgi:hypothetical protein
MLDRDDDEEYKKWSRAVKVASNFCCELCGATKVYLESHHKNAWSSFPEQRYLLQNGISLCKYHHDTFHKIYNKGGNTEFQWKEFAETYNILKKIVEK